jgi:hypothetical protein
MTIEDVLRRRNIAFRVTLFLGCFLALAFIWSNLDFIARYGLALCDLILMGFVLLFVQVSSCPRCGDSLSRSVRDLGRGEEITA